jgi:hypothetical protein
MTTLTPSIITVVTKHLAGMGWTDALITAAVADPQVHDAYLIRVDIPVPAGHPTREPIVLLYGDGCVLEDSLTIDDWTRNTSPEACPGCRALPGEGRTLGCTHPEGCGF